MELGGKQIRKRQAVIAVFAVANRDPERFADPDRLDLRRQDNRHVAFAWGSHYCFGAPLARMEGQIAFERPVSYTHLFDRARILDNWEELYNHRLQGAYIQGKKR